MKFFFTRCKFFLFLAINFCSNQNTEPTTTNTNTSKAISNEIPLVNCLGLSTLFDSNCKKIKDQQVNSDKIDWIPLNETDPIFTPFLGVVKIGGCTGSLINVNSSATSPAYILTNGHCVGEGTLPSGKGIFYDKDLNLSVYFHYFVGKTQDAFHTHGIKAAVYTMDKTDFAIVELEENFGFYQDKGYPSYKIAKKPPSKGDQIILVGSPGSYVEEANLGLRLSSCFVGGTANLFEGEYNFAYSRWYSGCSMIGGNSGSPIFDFSTHEVVLVNNTTVNDPIPGDEPLNACDLDKPCEEVNKIKIIQINRNYGQPIWQLNGCFNADGIFEKTLDTCKL